MFSGTCTDQLWDIGEIDNLTIIVEDFTIPPSIMCRTSRQKITKEIEPEKNYTNLIDIYNILHPITAEYKFFSSTHGLFSRIAYMLDHKANINKFEIIKNIQVCFLQYWEAVTERTLRISYILT